MRLKDMLDKESVEALAGAIKQVYPAFQVERFVTGVFGEKWEGYEFKGRIRHISTVLHDFLPREYRATLDILRQALPVLSGYGLVKIVFPDYVEAYGLEDWEASISAMELFTQYVSAEFAIRPFIAVYTERTMAQMLRWARHESAEVRRLATEGCRPLLPWGIRLAALRDDPSPILPILEELKEDESESVRKSVANNLNDISKDNPDVVLGVLQRWQACDTAEMRWIVSHALRTLVKKGHSEALELLGYPTEPAVAVHNLAVEPAVVPLGGKMVLSFDIESLGDAPQNLMIDYVLYLMRARGEQTPKVFKLAKKTIQPGETLRITKTVDFRPVTTRKYYSGEHAIEPQINGKTFGRVDFAVDDIILHKAGQNAPRTPRSP
jgi:3-methyladenine DNA glycosylase AlkC